MTETNSIQFNKEEEKRYKKIRDKIFKIVKKYLDIKNKKVKHADNGRKSS